MSNNIITGISNSFNRELKRMVSRPVYFISVVLVIAFCFVFFLTFFDEGQPNDMPIAVVDQDNSTLSRQFIRNLDATQQANVKLRLKNHYEARSEMQKGTIYGFVEIKKGFASEAISGRRPPITFYINDSYLIAGSLLLKDITYMSALTSGAIQQQILRAKGIDESLIMGIIQPISIETHLIGNPWANYGTYLLNVLLPGVLQLMVLLMTIFAIGVEFKERSSRKWIESGNNSIFAALTGKLLPYSILFTIVGIIGNILLYKYMHYPLNSHIGWIFAATLLYVLAYQAIGVLLIGITPVLRDGVTMSAFYGLLGFTFAGFTFPIEQMPYMAQIFSDLFPIRHYFNIYVNLALHGVDIKYSLISYMALISFNILPFFVYHRLKNAATDQNFPTK